MKPQENTTFANRYQLERLLGHGGFSEVWLAKDNYTKLNIAIKVYAPGQGMDSDGLAEFSAELAGVFNLNHTNLLKPTHVDTWEGMPYLILPYCSRGSISKQIGRMPENEIWKLIHDVASGLAYLHKNDIVHQDIKPDNILLDDAGNYVITDFGISTKARSTLRKSVIGGAVSGGTMAYMGPERFSKQPAPIKASDVWSFGAMIYELITGNVPFGEMGGGMQKAGAEIPEISEPISNELRHTIEKMLALNTWDRPTAEQLAKRTLPVTPVKNEVVLDDPASKINSRATQRYPEQKDRVASEPMKQPVNIVYAFLKVVVIALVLAVIYVIIMAIVLNSDNKPTSTAYSEQTIAKQETHSKSTIDKSKVQRLITDICKSSCKGGNYNAMQAYFTYTISPHPSGETRYNYNIGEKTKNYVERYPEYSISSPFNFEYVNSTFPLTVKCDVSVTWKLNSGVRKRAWIHKTYYITSDYKVSGYQDKEYSRETL